jgi:hypothetical protein
MPKRLAIVTDLMGILIAAGFGFARGDGLIMILVSLDLAQLGAKPSVELCHETPSWCCGIVTRLAKSKMGGSIACGEP